MKHSTPRAMTIHGVFILMLAVLIQLTLSNSVYAADSTSCYWLDNALDGPLHKKECILEKEDITATQSLHPIDFWKRIGRYANNSITVQPDASIMEHSLFQIYFFGNFPSVLLNPKITKGFEDSAAYLASLSDSKQKGVLGKASPKKDETYVVADDMPYEPILRTHRQYRNDYYPRIMGTYALTFLKGFYLTKQINYRNRFFNMIDYLMYSQFQKDGSNQFIHRFCSKENSGCSPVDKRIDTSAWVGGFDSLFDWKWKDAYGYEWQFHEPDHHVNSINAVSLVKGYEISQDKKYLNAAHDFVYNQIPRYGFHTGVWKNKRFYWTEYNPSGEANPIDDATDNVQSLVAHPVAMVGYYTKHPALLEYARGLLWYNLREFKMDSRWFYDGAENKKNNRKAVSHDSATLKSAIEALPYLIKSGMDVEDLIAGYYDAFMQYLHYDNPSVSKIIWNLGQVGKSTSKDIPADRAYMSTFKVRGWKTFSQEPKIKQPVEVTYLFQINEIDVLRKQDKLLLIDSLLHELEPGSAISISRYSFVPGLAADVTTHVIKDKSSRINNIFSGLSNIQTGDVVMFSFKWTPMSSNSLAYKDSNFRLFIQNSAQGKQEPVRSLLIVTDPGTGFNTDLLKSFHREYFLPQDLDIQF